MAADGPDGLVVLIDRAACIGVGDCAARAPRAFAVDADRKVCLVSPAGEYAGRIWDAARACQGSRKIHRELMRRSVLTCIKALAAVVAQVGEEMHVRLAEFQPPRHGREHRAEAFAVAAGVADVHLADRKSTRLNSSHT